LADDDLVSLAPRSNDLDRVDLLIQREKEVGEDEGEEGAEAGRVKTGTWPRTERSVKDKDSRWTGLSLSDALTALLMDANNDWQQHRAGKFGADTDERGNDAEEREDEGVNGSTRGVFEDDVPNMPSAEEKAAPKRIEAVELRPT